MTAGAIEQAKETYDGFEQVGIGVAHTNAHRLRQVTISGGLLMISENLYE
jgi:hypothetical protein